MRDPRARLVAGAIALALFGACSSSGSKGTAETTVATAPPETTTTAAADPFAIPALIDETYVNRVLAALDQIDGDVVRDIVSRGTITFESNERIRAIYNDPEYDQQADGLRDLLAGDSGRFKTPPGNRKTTVLRLMHADPECIFAAVKVDFSQVVVSPPSTEPDEFQALILERTQPEADLKGLNPTGWSIRHDEVLRGGQDPKAAKCGGQ